MTYINLLKALPKTKRDLQLLETRRKLKSWGDDKISRLFGFDYFDGDRKYGYGGYHYDGRWVPVASDIIKHYNLGPFHTVLDVGCAKGYLVKDLLDQEIEVYGIDVSKYALKHCHDDVVGHLHYGDVLDLHFPDNSFSLVLCINVLHNLEEKFISLALKEIMRVSHKHCFVQVDSYTTEEERRNFEDWTLTAKTHMYPEEWVDFFKECGYTGDYDFTIHEFED